MSPSQIRSLRLRLNMTTDEFAELLGFVGKNRGANIWRWEKGKRHPGAMARRVLKQVADKQKAAE